MATFTQFDITDYYSSIYKCLLLKGINFTKDYVEFTDDIFKVILASRKTLLTNDNSTWIKSH